MNILYHYCSTQTFHSIIERGELQLSSLSLSNDLLEGKLVKNTFLRLAERDGLRQADIEKLQDLLQLMEPIFDGLGFCLSEDGDLLSQWRGYADDGAGIAIGFSDSYLSWLGKESRTEEFAGFNLEKVVYETVGHEAELVQTYQQAKEVILEGALNFPARTGLLDTRTEEEIEAEKTAYIENHRKLYIAVLPLLFKLFLLKSDAFQEEKEWRLISLLGQQIDDFSQHRAKRDRIIPYRTYPLLDKQRQPIVEVVLGPKHLTEITTVENFLKRNGFGDVKTRRSKASYR